MKRIFTIFASIILIATLAISMVGCGPEESEAKELVKDLVSRSLELNDIYFGKNSLKYKDSGNPNDIYMPVLETEKYVFKTDLVEATKKVFSADYASSIIDMAFKGVQSEININSAQSRFMVMGDDDWLYINRNYEYVYEEGTVYDFDTIVITYTSSRFVEATVNGTYMTEDGPKEAVISVNLVCENDQWRLNSATY